MGGETKTWIIRHARCAGVEVKVQSPKSKVQSPRSLARERAFIALGSNLGDARRNVLRAVDKLKEFSDEPLACSSLWQTRPVDCPPGSAWFVNAVVALTPRAGTTPIALLSALQGL